MTADLRVVWNPDGESAYASSQNEKAAAFVGEFTEQGRPAWCVSLGRRKAEDLIDCAAGAGLQVDEARFRWLGGAQPLPNNGSQKQLIVERKPIVEEIGP